MKINEFLISHFKRAGIELVLPEGGLDAELQDSDIEKLNEAMITMREAHEHSKLKTFHVDRYLNGINDKLLERADELGLEDDVKDLFKKDNKVKFLDKLNKFIDTLQSKNATDSIRKKYNDLVSELENVKNTHIEKSQYDSLVDKYNREREDAALSSIVGKINWSDTYAQDFRTPLFKIALDKKLAELGARAKYDETKKGFVLLDGKEDLPFFDKGNKIITFEELSNTVALDNKFIAVSDPATPKTQTVPPTVKEFAPNPLFKNILENLNKK
jgi:hypothetical protein